MNNRYYQQVNLMLKLLPIVSEEFCFSLKGGTAINLFVRDMPRLSVDIDLTYTELDSREVALAKLSEAAERIASQIEKRFPHLHVIRQHTKKTNRLVKLLVNDQHVQVKVEPNELIRGSVFPVETRRLSEKTAQEFGAFVEMRVLSFADLYGGKICAALDRQHPRDLFDVKLLLDNEGLTDDVRKAFIVYLASHNRPMNELLDPNFLDIKQDYLNNFQGMTDDKFTFESLVEAREQLVSLINEALTGDERQFLLALKQGEPQWELLGIPKLDQFPALQWKLLNIGKMDGEKHQQSIKKLKAVLQL